MSGVHRIDGQVEGTHDERPDASPANAGILYIETDTGLQYYSNGETWIPISDGAGPDTDTFVTLTDVDISGVADQQVLAYDQASGDIKPLPGVTGDGDGGLDVLAGISQGDGTATASHGIKMGDGQTALPFSITDHADAPKASIAADGEIVTVDDVLAPFGTVKGAVLAFNPTVGTGAPVAGAHNAGEMVMDSTGAVFVCTATGTPGTWKQATLT